MFESITSNPFLAAICGFNFLFALFLLAMNIVNKRRIRKLRDKYTKFMRGVSGTNIEHLLTDVLDRIDRIADKNKEYENHINNLERNLLLCVQKVGVIRYNAFDNVGSDLSFSIALLDDNDNGLVLSGLYSRDSSSTYAKPVVTGKSRYALSAEELKALEVARKAHRERQYTED